MKWGAHTLGTLLPFVFTFRSLVFSFLCFGHGNNFSQNLLVNEISFHQFTKFLHPGIRFHTISYAISQQATKFHTRFIHSIICTYVLRHMYIGTTFAMKIDVMLMQFSTRNITAFFHTYIHTYICTYVEE
jgi:hypothetical protein